MLLPEVAALPVQVQAEDRAHRIGQARSVNIYMLHARGSVDDVIWATLQGQAGARGAGATPDQAAQTLPGPNGSMGASRHVMCSCSIA